MSKVLLAFLLLIPQAASLHAAEGGRTLSGIIYFTNNTPRDLETFPVELYSRDQQTRLAGTNANARGNFQLAGLEPGKYLLKFTWPPNRCTLWYKIDVPANADRRLRVIMDAACSGNDGTVRDLPADSFMNAGAVENIQDDHAADRAAIRAHIESIFEAFIRKDSAALRATHADNWLGYLEGSRTMIKGVDGYMDWNQVDPKSPYGMKSYRVREFDMIFKGDAAFVCFVADVEAMTPGGPYHRVLRISDFYTKQDGKWIQNGSDTALHPESFEKRMQALAPLSDEWRKSLLDAREAVWRAYFAGDRATLEKLIPEETIAIEASHNNWSNRQTILDGSAEFAKSGGRLIKLEFPKTEIQLYGYTAVVYSNYVYELEAGGQRINQSGRVTEVFVMRGGQWVNPGWHMDGNAK